MGGVGNVAIGVPLPPCYDVGLACYVGRRSDVGGVRATEPPSAWPIRVLLEGVATASIARTAAAVCWTVIPPPAS